MHLKSCEGDCIFARKSHQNAFNFLFSSYRNWNESSTYKLYNNKSDCSHVPTSVSSTYLIHINPLYLTPRNTTTAIHEPEPNVSRTKVDRASVPINWNFRTGTEPNFLKILGPRRTGTKKDWNAVRWFLNHLFVSML